MASSAIFLTIIAPIAIASGFRIETAQPKSAGISGAPAAAATDYRNQPIAGYPKVPPPNAHESGGSDDDLLPPLENRFFKRSAEDAKVDPKTGYPLVAEPSWKDAGGNEEHLEPPLDDSVKAGGEQGAVDPKTGYPLVAQPHWKDAGGDGGIIALPLEDAEENFGKKEEAVDPKTGYPLNPNPSWKDAGGDGEILELPLENVGSRTDKAVDPKTGYPLVAEDGWKHAGGDGEILELPLEEPKEDVDPKTGYPLLAQPGWKDAGGNGDILELPLEETEQVAVDPKTGYPLIAQPSWKDAGGDGDILQTPLEPSSKQPSEEAVDPKTGYPLKAQPQWKDAGGNEDILELPLEQPNAKPEIQSRLGGSESSDKPASEAVDPKNGYPLVAQQQWRGAGGDENILELPLEQANANGGIQGRLAGREAKPPSEAVDPKTGYPLVAQPQWREAGGDENILELPAEEPRPVSQGRSVPTSEAVDPKTGYPLIAQPQWRGAGGDENILQLPLEQPMATVGSAGGRYHELEIYKLTELQPPPLEKNSPTVFSNSFSTPVPPKQSFSGVALVHAQKRNPLPSQTRFDSYDQRPIESSYTYYGPENVVVTVTRYLNTDRQQKPNQPESQSRHFRSDFTGNHGGLGLPPSLVQPIFPQTGHENFNGRH